MKTMLKLARDLLLPLAVITERMAFMGQSGSGKTYSAGVMVEQMLDVGAQVLIIDPSGAWWGLAYGADGKSPGYPIIIMGGKHGHIPLDPKSGKLVAEFVCRNRGTPVLLDLSDMTLSQQAHFMSELGQALWDGQRADPRPLHVVLEEAHIFVPQELPAEAKEAAVMLGRWRRNIKVGRNHGLGVSMLSQEPQSVDKRCLNLASVLFTFAIQGKKERGAIEAWFGDNVRKHKVQGIGGMDFDFSDLQTFDDGQALVCSPKVLKFSGIRQIGKKKTFDSSKTPEFGEKIRLPKKAAKVDIDGLRSQMAEMVGQAEADDPKALRRRIAELEALVKKGKPANENRVAAPVQTKIQKIKIEVPVLSKAQEAKIDRLGKALFKVGEWSESLIKQLQAVVGKASSQPAPIVLQPQPIQQVRPATAVERLERLVAKDRAKATMHNLPKARPMSEIYQPRLADVEAAELGEMVKGERKVLVAIAQHQDGCSAEQITVLTGYKRTTRELYLQRLARRKLVTRGRGTVRASDTLFSAPRAHVG